MLYHRKMLIPLGRSFSWRYPTHRWVLLAATIAVFLNWLQGETMGSILWSSMAVLLTWALAREGDPDQPHQAVLIAMLASVVVVVFGTPELTWLGALLLTIRMVNHTVRQHLSLLDYLLGLGSGLWLVSVLVTTGQFSVTWPVFSAVLVSSFFWLSQRSVTHFSSVCDSGESIQESQIRAGQWLLLVATVVTAMTNFSLATSVLLQLIVAGLTQRPE